MDITRATQSVGDIPVVSSGGISSYHNVAHAYGPGVVIGRKGTIGKAFYIAGPYWPHDTTLWVREFNGNDPKFVYYFMSKFDVSWLEAGSANPTLNRNHLHPVVVTWPDVLEQRAIAELLGALDDKIAANAALVRSLSNAAAWELAGSLRDGYKTISIAEAATLIARGIAPQYVEPAEGTRVLNQKCVRDQSVSLEPSRWTSPSRVRPEKLLRRDDVLVNSTGQGTLGRVARWSSLETATVDSHVTIVRPNPTVSATSVIGQAILAIEADIEALGEGSTGQTELSRVQLGQAQIRLPDLDRARLLGRAIDALVDRADAAREENHTLAATRDALLPQLMSGKLRVRDAEAIAADAGA